MRSGSFAVVALSFPAVAASDSDAKDSLSLLQTRAAVHTAETLTGPKDPIPANAKTPQYPLKKKHPPFGPDGTWATPYCKSLLGCVPYCVNGCNGVAIWESSIHPPGLGNADKDDYDATNPGAHFLTCVQGDSGRGRPPSPDWKMKVHGGFVQCTNSENSTKKPFWRKTLTTAEKDVLKIAWGTNDDGVTKSWNSGGAIGDGDGWGNEFCPDGCVNDCAEFKLGGFLSCGINGGTGWTGYNGGKTNAAGPNYYCPQNVVSGTGHQAWTWCGEKKVKVETPDDFVCDLCAASDNDFDPTGKKGKCERINERAQKSVKRCEKRKGRAGVIKRCCPDPPVECPLCPAGTEFNNDNLDGKCAKFAAKATKNQEVCDKIKGKKRVQKKCCEESASTATAAPVEEQKVGYIETKGVSCGWSGACGGDKNQDYINNGARQLSASASDVTSCEALCDEHDTCDGFCLVGTECYFRKDTECNDMPATAGRSCWQKPVEGRQCSSGQFQGGEAC